MAESKPADRQKKLDLADPQHWLYCGVTQTGKTTLARWHARRLDMYGHRVIVYDPVRTATKGGDWPERARVYVDRKQFEKDIVREQDAYVFVDEAPDVFSHEQKANHWLLRKGRHQLLYFRLMCARPTMVHPNVRTQCSTMFMFRLARSDAQELCADFGHGTDVYARDLDTGDYLVVKSGSASIVSANVFNHAH